MIEEQQFIKRNQRKAYQNNEQLVYEVKIPNAVEGLVHFNPNTYILTLPKETKECTLSFEDSIVYLKGNKKGSLKPLDKIKILCECIIIDLTNGAYTIPLQIEAKSIILKGANYTKKITDLYTVDQENDLYRVVLNSILATNHSLSIRKSLLNLGTQPLNINCSNLHLADTRIILPYNEAKINCHTFKGENSELDIQREKLTLYSDATELKDTIISSAKPSEVELGETLLKGNSEVNIETAPKSIK